MDTFRGKTAICMDVRGVPEGFPKAPKVWQALHFSEILMRFGFFCEMARTSKSVAGAILEGHFQIKLGLIFLSSSSFCKKIKPNFMQKASREGVRDTVLDLPRVTFGRLLVHFCKFLDDF